MSGICKILAVTSGRADASPMRPVIDALRERGCDVFNYDAGGSSSLEGMVCHLESMVDQSHDLMLLLGDRYEILAAAFVATVFKLPIAHIHGGEASFGSFDNQIRNAVTKLSHIHFVANAAAKNRLNFKLDEDGPRIHVVGAPGLDVIAPMLEAKREPENKFIVTWHPETLGDDAGLPALIEALKQFPDYDVMWTEPNNDPGSESVREIIKAAGISFVTYNPKGGYPWNVYNCAAVIGNSSSGIIEAPTLGVPTVNIGTRQDGRMKGRSIYDVGAIAYTIVGMISAALTHDQRERPYDQNYGTPGASAKIADVLAEIDLDGILVKKWQ